MEQHGHVVKPARGGNTATGREHDDGMRIGGGDGLDQNLLSGRKLERAVVPLSLGVGIKAHADHRHVRQRRDFGDVGRQHLLRRQRHHAGANQVGLGDVFQANGHGLARRQINLSALRRLAIPKIAALADVAVVSVGFDPDTEGEGHDRTFQLPPGQEILVKAVAAANPHTIVVLTAGGSVSTAGWLDHVPVLLHTWYAGSQGGNALAEILFGRANPGGAAHQLVDARGR